MISTSSHNDILVLLIDNPSYEATTGLILSLGFDLLNEEDRQTLEHANHPAKEVASSLR